jgi:LmbE family N-acetylglucosaminyl deacetylase
MAYSFCMGLKFEKILVIGAHPDDIEYSCLGFLLKQKEQGSSIYAYVASLGGINDPSSGLERKIESDAALSLNGFEKFYTQNNHFDYFEIEKAIRSLVLKFGIDCVMVHSPLDTHQDHRLLHDITLSALRRIKVNLILYRSVSTTREFVPNLQVGVEQYMSLKLKTLLLHKSQLDKVYMDKVMIEKFHTYYNIFENSEKFYEAYTIVSIVD